MTRFRSAGVVACGDSACDHLRVAEARQIAGEGFGDVPAGNVVIPALGHGPVLIALVYAIGHVSGCHINPAVTISLVAIGKLPLKRVGPYLVTQVADGLVGGPFHFWVRPLDDSFYGLTLPGPGIGEG